MKKRILAVVCVLALSVGILAACGGSTPEPAPAGSGVASGSGVAPAPAADAKITILVPNADHGWTGAVMTYAEEKAAELTAAGYTVKVTTSADANDQIQQVEDIIENKTATHVVILPQDNTLEATVLKLADSGIPFIMFDRIIAAAEDKAVANVKGDNYGIGAETAKRFLADGMQAGNKVLIMPGDNSSVPEMRNDGFYTTLKEAGWTDADIANVSSTDYTGWSRSKAKELFVSWMEAQTVGDIQNTKWIFTHDSEIIMGIFEALHGTELDAEKKAAFLGAGITIGSSSGLNEVYSVFKGIHKNDYSAEFGALADCFDVTYDPAMIKIAVDDMITYIEGGQVAKDHVVPVEVVDKENVDQYQGFGDPVSK